MLEGLLDEATETKDCKITTWRTQLTDEDRAIFDTAMAGDIPTNTLYYRLKQRDMAPFSPATFERHRKGHCRCLQP